MTANVNGWEPNLDNDDHADYGDKVKSYGNGYIAEAGYFESSAGVYDYLSYQIVADASKNNELIHTPGRSYDTLEEAMAAADEYMEHAELD